LKSTRKPFGRTSKNRSPNAKKAQTASPISKNEDTNTKEKQMATNETKRKNDW